MIDIAVKAAVEAGEAILEIYAQDFEVEFKADESPLTSADKAGHEIIVQALETTPYPVLSEESGEITLPTEEFAPEAATEMIIGDLKGRGIIS